MREAEGLLADLRSRGVELETDGKRLRWRPSELVTAPQAETIRFHQGAIVALLLATESVTRCTSCRRPLDSKRRCWRCCDRACESCGRPTGSAFLALCLLCENEPERSDTELQGDGGTGGPSPPPSPATPSLFQVGDGGDGGDG